MNHVTQFNSVLMENRIGNAFIFISLLPLFIFHLRRADVLAGRRSFAADVGCARK